MKCLRGFSFVVVIAAAVLVFSTGTSLAASAAYKSAAKSSTASALDLYRDLGAKGGNMFLSPYSISSAMAMTYAGARGNTAAEMKKTLHFELEQVELNSAFRGLNAHLAATAEQSDQKLNIANALVMTGGKVSRNYSETLAKYYSAEFFSGGLDKINGWVRTKTEGKIPTILEQLSANSVCVILNAIYFKGAWDVQFDPKFTVEKPFRLSAGQEVATPLMFRRDDYRLVEEEDYQALSLPYKGKALSMVVFLPRSVDGLPALEKKLTADFITGTVAKLDKQAVRKVMVYFPKFKLETSYDLGGPFLKLGMKDAFGPGADFSGMGWPKGDLWIGQIKHKAFVEVNEEGTEAAAATAVEMVTKSAPPRELIFKADHPFFFLIRDNETGTVLFMGRLADPKK